MLRHNPGSVDLTLDAGGWVAVDELLAALGRRGVQVTRSDLDDVVVSSDKQRFAYDTDGSRIRANQGHSVAVELGLPVVTAPALLFHGTVAAALPGIRATGLTRQRRHHVHLSADTATARPVGARRGEAIVLTIDAGAMAAAGLTFFRSANGVWLTVQVPVRFIVGGLQPVAHEAN